MNTIFKNLCAAAILVLAVVSCELVPSCNGPFQDNPVGRKITAIIELNPNATSKITTEFGESIWNFEWEDADVVFAIDNNDNITSLTRDADSQFSGEIADDATSVRFLYTGNGATPTIHADKITLDISGQDGALNKLCMISDIESVGTESEFRPKLKHIGSFIKVDKVELSNTDYYPQWETFSLDGITLSGFSSEIEVDITKNHKEVGFAVKGSSVGNLSATLGEKVLATNGEIRFDEPLYMLIPPGDAPADAKICIDFTNGVRVNCDITETSFNRAQYSNISPLANFETANDNDRLDFLFVNESGAELLFGASDTYYIASEKNLRALASLANISKQNTGNDGYLNETNNTFVLNNDIEVDENVNWAPIGYNHTAGGKNAAFEGVFDGAGHTISGIRCVAEEDSPSGFISIGLFGYLNGGATVVKNLVLDDCIVTMKDEAAHTAILVGTLQGSTLSKCGCSSTCSATINERGAVGGLVGMVETAASTIENCYNHGNVEAPDSDHLTKTTGIGGLCGGTTANTTITNCYNSGDVTLNNPNSTPKYYLGAVIGNTYEDDSKVDAAINFTNTYYLADCAGEGVKACNSTSSTEYGADPIGVTPKSEEDMKTVGFDDLLGDEWEQVAGGYPTLVFN